MNVNQLFPLVGLPSLPRLLGFAFRDLPSRGERVYGPTPFLAQGKLFLEGRISLIVRKYWVIYLSELSLLQAEYLSAVRCAELPLTVD